MASLATTLGLTSTGVSQPPSYAPYYLMFNFVCAYALFSTRGAKFRLGLDNNVCPREDVHKAEDAVRSGKITRVQLDKLKRQEAAHANAVENFTLLVAGLLSAQYAGVPAHVINTRALTYTLARIGFNIAYVYVDTVQFSWFRTIFWWSGNISMLNLLWKSARATGI